MSIKFQSLPFTESLIEAAHHCVPLWNDPQRLPTWVLPRV